MPRYSCAFKGAASPGRFLERYPVVLLDMNQTFMFGGDRFGPDQDFFATYRRLGGARLDRLAVHAAIRLCYDGMARDYADPTKRRAFPSLDEALKTYAHAADQDLPDLHAVFAEHESGHIPERHIDYLHQLSQSHELGVVSNIWAGKARWLQEFERAGVAQVFKTCVFSSDDRIIKPDPALFVSAAAAFHVAMSSILFVGDSLRFDIEPAKALGMGTAWIDSSMAAHPLADVVVSSLPELDHAVP